MDAIPGPTEVLAVRFEKSTVDGLRYIAEQQGRSLSFVLRLAAHQMVQAQYDKNFAENLRELEAAKYKFHMEGHLRELDAQVKIAGTPQKPSEC